MLRTLALGLLLALTAGCITHSRATDTSGVTDIRGEPFEYQMTSSYSLRFLFLFDLFGTGSTPDVVEEFAAEAQRRGSTRMRITQTSSTTYWYVFPPLSFFIHPVVTSVEGDAEILSMDAEE